MVMTKMGRHKVEVDWGRLDQACSVGCTLQECAGILSNHQGIAVSEDVIEFRIREEYDLTFSEYRDKKEAPKYELLRERLWDTALSLKGSPVDRIWVSKNKLNWTDKQEVQQKADPAVLEMLERQLTLSRQLRVVDVIEGEVIAEGDSEG